MKLVSITFALLLVLPLYSQSLKFGEVSVAEVRSIQDAKFPDARAVILYRNVDSYLGNYVKVHERIKIFTEEGFDYATVYIPYRDIKKVQGATYNWVNGKLEVTELEGDLIFKDDIIEDAEFKKFTFPNVSRGSVLEYTYITEYGSWRNIDLQYDIPIRRERVEVTNKLEIGVEILQNPLAFLDVNRMKKGKSVIFTVRDVPPLEAEDYVFDINLYRSYLKTNFTWFEDGYRIGNWEDLGGIILENDDFRNGIKPKRFYRDELETLIGDEKNKMIIAKKIYALLKNNIRWNKEYDYFPDKTIRDAYNDEEGNSASMNLLYVSMLRSVGIRANPVLVSSKWNGIPLTASWGAFDAVLVDVPIGQNNFVVDVASSSSTFHYLDPQFMNWKGLRIYKDDSYDWVGLDKFKMSNMQIIGNARITESRSFEGIIKERHSGYFNLEVNQNLEYLGEDKIDEIIFYQKEGLDIFEVKAESNDEDFTDISFEFQMDGAIDEIDGKLYFSPLLFLTLEENPFQKETRKYAIDFGYPFKQQTMFTFDLPEGYNVESMPEPTKLIVSDMGSFLFQASSVGGKVQVMTSYEIYNHFLSNDMYDEIQGFFKARMEKEAEKVVLTKV